MGLNREKKAKVLIEFL